MSRTTAVADFRWKREGSFLADATPTRPFGFSESLGSVRVANGAEALTKFGDRNKQGFRFGVAEGGFSAEFSLSSPWFLALLFGATPVKTGSSVPYNYALKVQPTAVSFATWIRANLATAVAAYFYQGCIISSFSLNTSVRDVARCSLEVMSSNYTISHQTDALANNPRGPAFAKFANATKETAVPYTFLEADVKLQDGSSTNQAIGVVQSVDASFETGQEVRHGLGSAVGKSLVAKGIGYSGSIRVDSVDSNNFKRVASRRRNHKLILKFDNGESANNKKEAIEFTFSGISFPDVSADFREVEVIEDNLRWQATTCTVKVTTPEAAWVV